jgi:hypothetical protein
MALLDDVKLVLGLKTNSRDSVINDLIFAVKAELKAVGINPVKVDDEADPLIKVTIETYCKAYFGRDNPDAEMLIQCYENFKKFLTMVGDYRVLE